MSEKEEIKKLNVLLKMFEAGNIYQATNETYIFFGEGRPTVWFFSITELKEEVYKRTSDQHYE